MADLASMSTEELCAKANAAPDEARFTEEMLKRLEVKQSALNKLRVEAKSTDSMLIMTTSLQKQIAWYTQDFCDTLSSFSMGTLLLPCMFFMVSEGGPQTKIMMATFIMFVMYLGKKVTDRLENSEWRKKLKADSDAVTSGYDDLKVKAQERIEARKAAKASSSSSGSTKKTAKKKD